MKSTWLFMIWITTIKLSASKEPHFIDNSVNAINKKEINNLENTQTDEGIVLTTYGPVRGYIHEGTPKIKRFFDIPYGSFDAENLYQTPKPPASWDKVHEVSEHKSRCPQIEYPDTYVGNTDCLTLNIMAPTSAVNADVLFHIHGESFNRGSGDPAIYGPDYLVPKGIVLVLPNYRLGPLGFLCMLNETAPGNAALKDLTQALKWITDNIAAFGGNPANIVVSGEGSAGVLAGYLAVSPASRDYVSKVIAESGSILSHWALDRDPVATATRLAEYTQIPVETVVSKVDKFENVNIRQLVFAAKDIKFAPCLETGNKTFLNDTPWSMLNSLKTNISYMIGSANHAGMEKALKHTESTLSILNQDFSKLLPDDLYFNNDEETRSKIGHRLKYQYFGQNHITEENIEKLSFCYTDCSYLGPMVRLARSVVTSGAAVYFYEFSFVPKLNEENTPSLIRGAARGDIVKYVFHRTGHIPSTEELYMVNVTTNLWQTFIQNGKPTMYNVDWPEFQDTSELDENWLLIGSEVKEQKGVHVNRLKLWTEIYENYFIDHNRGYIFTPHTCSFFSFILFFNVTKFISLI